MLRFSFITSSAFLAGYLLVFGFSEQIIAIKENIAVSRMNVEIKSILAAEYQMSKAAHQCMMKFLGHIIKSNNFSIYFTDWNHVKFREDIQGYIKMTYNLCRLRINSTEWCIRRTSSEFKSKLLQILISVNYLIFAKFS